MALGCKFSQLQHYQILLESDNTQPSNHKDKKGAELRIFFSDTVYFVYDLVLQQLREPGIDVNKIASA